MQKNLCHAEKIKIYQFKIISKCFSDFMLIGYALYFRLEFEKDLW